jgi:hypothetical protein
MIWANFEAASPVLAARGKERFEQAGVALLGTIRKDGSPRISPVEPFFAAGHLLLGLLPWSLKARDLTRDPRCVLHNIVTAPSAGESEFKLYGSARPVDRRIRRSPTEAWWTARPEDEANVVSLDVDRAVLVEWDLERGVMKLVRWSPELGTRERTRPYP